MIKKMMRKFYKDEKGITGLETAIILIAFVVVASVFAYTVLSAGIFSSEKGKEAVYSGLSETQSAMELVGSVTAYSNVAVYDYLETPTTGVTAENTGSMVVKVEMVVSLASGNEQMDLTPYYELNGTNSGVIRKSLKVTCMLMGSSITWLTLLA